jgi:hypothetical protein
MSLSTASCALLTHLAQLRFRLLEPEGHAHFAIHRHRGSEALLSLPAISTETMQFAETQVAHEAKMIRLSESTRHAFTIGLAYYASATLYLPEGDWVKARPSIEHAITVARAGNVVRPLRRICRAGRRPATHRDSLLCLGARAAWRGERGAEPGP